MYLEGQLQTRKWQDQSGQDKYTTEVVLQRFRGELTLLDSRGGGGDRDSFPDDGVARPSFGRSSAGGGDRRPALSSEAQAAAPARSTTTFRSERGSFRTSGARRQLSNAALDAPRQYAGSSPHGRDQAKSDASFDRVRSKIARPLAGWRPCSSLCFSRRAGAFFRRAIR